jgi:hypothetical protein
LRIDACTYSFKEARAIVHPLFMRITAGGWQWNKYAAVFLNVAYRRASISGTKKAQITLPLRHFSR